jgi:hypothetical protein
MATETPRVITGWRRVFVGSNCRRRPADETRTRRREGPLSRFEMTHHLAIVRFTNPPSYGHCYSQSQATDAEDGTASPGFAALVQSCFASRNGIRGVLLELNRTEFGA